MFAPAASEDATNGVDVTGVGRSSAMLALLAVLSGCATVDAMTGKDRLQQDLDLARTTSRATVGELESRIHALEQEKHDLQAKLDALGAQHATARNELETLRTERSTAAGRINVLLFRGDIVYAVAPTAFGDYRAGLRLHALNDSAFGEALQQFEKREGGDGALLRVLRKIDTNSDLVISLEETREFREQQESSLKRDGE